MFLKRQRKMPRLCDNEARSLVGRFGLEFLAEDDQVSWTF